MSQLPRPDAAEMVNSEVSDYRVRKALCLLSQSTDLQAQELAEAVHLSPSRLSRLFKRETDISLGRFIIRLRMRYAARLLEVTERPVKVIAFRVGYSHPSSFCRAFHNHFETYPQEYREAQRLRPTA